MPPLIMISPRAQLVSALIALAVLPGCRRSAAKADQRPPIVLISIDTLRADHLPAYGYRNVETPNIDRLRRDSILFENAYSHAPLTLPAHASLLTGRLPFEHGIRDNLGYRLDPAKHPTLAAELKKRGYATGAAVSAYVLRGATGISDGFDFYEDRIAAPEGTDALGRVQRKGSDTLAAVKPWLARVKDGPFFLFFHTYEPHAPYEPPEPFRSRFALPYDGEIATADAVVGGLIDELKHLSLYDRAVVILLSDHGEGLGEHGEEEHGILLYRWALRVPLLLKLPGAERAGAVVREPAALVDVMTTIAGLTGFDPPKGLPGRSLLDLPRGSERNLYAETYYPRLHLGWSELRSLVGPRWQYIEGRRRELYDVVRDPGELEDVLAGNGPLARELQKELASHPAGLTAPAEVGSEERERLAALGYLEGVVETTGPLPDPRESIPVLGRVKAAFRLAAAGKNEEAVAVFHGILAEFPQLFDARFEMAQALVRLGRYEEALEAFRLAARSSPALANLIALHVGRVALKLGRYKEAEENARLALHANAAQAHELLARIALARDDLDAAEASAQAATGDAAAELGAAVVRAEVRIRKQRFTEALDVIESAKRQVRAHGLVPVPDLDFLRGDALARLGRHAEAQAAFEEEVGRYPANSQAWARLAIVLALQGRTVGEVDRVLGRMVAAHPTPETMRLAAKTLESLGDRRGAARWARRAEGQRK